MNAIERLTKALNFEEADRVPFDLCGTTVSAFNKTAFMNAMKYRNIAPAFQAKSVDPIQQIVIPTSTILDRLQIDTYRIGARRIMNFEEKVEEDSEYFSIEDPYECLWKMHKERDLYFNQVTYPYADFDSCTEALPHFKVYDINVWRDIMIADIDEQLMNAGDRGIILDRNCAGLTEMSLRIRGYDKWFMDTVLDPKGVESLLDVLLDHKIAYWQLMAEIIQDRNLSHRVMVVSEADDLGTQTSLLISPDSLKSMVIPKIKHMMSVLQQLFPTAKRLFHTDGAIMSIIPDLIEAGVNILNPVQYSAAGMNLYELKKKFGKDLVFWGGGIDTQEILNKATPEKVRDEVKKNIELLAPGGGFVFTTIHNIQADVPPQNFWAMWESLMENGKYN